MIGLVRKPNDVCNTIDQRQKNLINQCQYWYTTP
jgi:hypothetical protein